MEKPAAFCSQPGHRDREIIAICLVPDCQFPSRLICTQCMISGNHGAHFQMMMDISLIRKKDLKMEELIAQLPGQTGLAKFSPLLLQKENKSQIHPEGELEKLFQDFRRKINQIMEETFEDCKNNIAALDPNMNKLMAKSLEVQLQNFLQQLRNLDYANPEIQKSQVAEALKCLDYKPENLSEGESEIFLKGGGEQLKRLQKIQMRMDIIMNEFRQSCHDIHQIMKSTTTTLLTLKPSRFADSIEKVKLLDSRVMMKDLCVVVSQQVFFQTKVNFSFQVNDIGSSGCFVIGIVPVEQADQTIQDYSLNLKHWYCLKCKNQDDSRGLYKKKGCYPSQILEKGVIFNVEIDFKSSRFTIQDDQERTLITQTDDAQLLSQDHWRIFFYCHFPEILDFVLL